MTLLALLHFLIITTLRLQTHRQKVIPLKIYSIFLKIKRKRGAGKCGGWTHHVRPRKTWLYRKLKLQPNWDWRHRFTIPTLGKVTPAPRNASWSIKINELHPAKRNLQHCVPACWGQPCHRSSSSCQNLRRAHEPSCQIMEGSGHDSPTSAPRERHNCTGVEVYARSFRIHRLLSLEIKSSYR